MDKYYICSHCKQIHSSSEWDKSTILKHGNDSYTILTQKQGVVFVCPSCGEDVEVGCADVTNMVDSHMEFNLGELMLIYDGLTKIPIDMILHSGEMKSGAKYETINTKELLEKVKYYGEKLEKEQVGNI